MIKAISIPDELVKDIDDIRRIQSPIPSFSKTVVSLLRRGIQAGEVKAIIKYCDACGSKLPIEGAKFCDRCGIQISQEVT